MQRDRVEPTLVLPDGSAGRVRADDDHLAVVRRSMVGLEHEVEVALARPARKGGGGPDLRRLGREDENAMVVALRPFLVAADGMGLGDHLRVLPAAGLPPAGKDDTRGHARVEAVAAPDALRPKYDAGGRDLHLRGRAED